MLKSSEKILFFSFYGLILETKTSLFIALLIQVLPNLQFVSFQFDTQAWSNISYLRLELIELSMRLLGFSRIGLLYDLSGLGSNWKALPFGLVSIPNLSSFAIFLLYYFEIKACLRLNEKFGYDLEFTETSRYDEIRMRFQKRTMISVKTDNPLEDRLNQSYYKTHHSLMIFALKIYNLMLPVLILPFTEVYIEMIYELASGGIDSYFWAYGALSILGVISLAVQTFMNVLLFNDFAFDDSRHLNRNVRVCDLLYPLSQAIAPIIAYSGRSLGYSHYINACLQVATNGYLLWVFSNKSSYFNPRINDIYGGCLIFRILVSLLFVLCTFLDDFPAFLILFLGLAIRFSFNLTRLISCKVTNRLNLKSLSMKEFSDENESQILHLTEFKDNYNAKLLSFFSHFYYLTESVKPTFFQILEEVPIVFIGLIREHLNLCSRPECPLIDNPYTEANLLGSSSYLKKLGINFDWSESTEVRAKVARFVAEVYRLGGNIHSINDNETSFLYILYLLFNSKGVIRSILMLNSLFLRNLAFHERFILFSMREFMGKYLRLIEEKSFQTFNEKEIMQKRERQKRLKKEETRFESVVFIEIEKNFNQLNANIEEYVAKLKSLIKELMLEKVSISNIESLGNLLLRKHEDIKASFKRANKNVRFIKVYRDFINTFREDEWELRRDLTKLLHLINQVEENYEQANSNQGGNNKSGFNLTDETHFFNNKSCFLYVSGRERDLGKIIKTDENTAALFGYANATSMTGVSINDLMPKSFGERHSLVVMNFLESGEANFIYKENRLFGLTKQGFTFPLHITVKPYMNKSTCSLEFLSHIKPSLNKKENLIICDDLGNIDCFGEGLEPIFSRFYEKNRGQNLPIQVLIPDLLDFFHAAADEFVKENKESLERNRSKWSRRKPIGLTSFSYRSLRSIMPSPRKKVGKARQRLMIDSGLIFSNFLKNEFGDLIVQVVLKDNYPTFPSVLNLENVDEGSISNYLHHIKNLVLSNEAPCDVYRVDIEVETRACLNSTINVLHVRRLKHLYRNKKNDSIEKVLKRLKNNKITLWPKILKQTGFLKICKRKNQNKIALRRMKSDEDIEKKQQSPQKPRHRRNSDITDSPNLFIEEANAFCEEIKPEIEKKLVIHELRKDREIIEKQLSAQLSMSFDRDLKGQNPKGLLKVGGKDNPESIQKFDSSLVIPSMRLDPPALSVVASKILNPGFSRTISMSNQSQLMKREEQTFFADEGRHLFKIQSKENSFANFSQTYEIEKEDVFEAASKASSLVSNTRDPKKEYRRLIEQKYLPSAYRNIVIFTSVAIILTIASFFSYGAISSQMLSDLSQQLFTTELVENYKIGILKILVVQQNYLAFGQEDNLQALNVTFEGLKALDFELKNPPLRGFSEKDLTIEITNEDSQNISIIMGMEVYFESVLDIKDGTLEQDFLIKNGLRLFKAMDSIFSFQGQIDDTLSYIKRNLVILVLLSLGLMSFLCFSIFTNLYFSHKVINSTLKLLCSIQIKDYKSLYVSFFEGNQNEKRGFKKKASVKSMKEIQSEGKAKNPNQGKKKIRHQVVALKFSKLNFLFLVIFLGVYATLFIVNLNESQLLNSQDSTLMDKLLRENFFNKIRLKFYHIFSILNDIHLNYNTVGIDDQALVTTMIAGIASDLDYLLTLGNYLTGSEKLRVEENINSDLCAKEALNEEPDLIDKCPNIANGVLQKGLYSSLMYLYTVFKGVLDGRVGLSGFESNQEIVLIMRVVDLAAKNVFSESIDNVANTLKTQSRDMLIINSMMACGVSSILTMFLYFVIKRYEKRLVLTKRILTLIPLSMLSKSQKIRKYLSATKKSTKF